LSSVIRTCPGPLSVTVAGHNGGDHRLLRISELVDLSVGNVNFEAKTFKTYRSNNTNYSNYSSQVSIDKQRRAENAFDRVKRKK